MSTTDDITRPATQAVVVPRRRSRHLWWAWSPAYTLGLVSFIPAVHAAIVLRRRGLWLFAAALIAADVLAWTLMSSSERNPDGSNTPSQNAGVILILVLTVLGTIHALRIRDEVFGTSGAGRVLPNTPVGRDAAVVTALAARQRRKEVAALSEADPGLARDLRVGRPDLVRSFDDGGLIDVNHVPEVYLVSHLGLNPAQARLTVEARERIGGFQNVAELVGFAEVPAPTLDAIRDRIVLL
ncbi:MAG: helix-hairpin-helix domain-containing protein [Actinobacteria bacterium]|nr:helix-hairpin-helix domain-containing protein [Actinomycetota bacterium]MCB9412194.1 helix-hairpin-helix domain-containing protein [Actinomycetota bacterium]